LNSAFFSTKNIKQQTQAAMPPKLVWGEEVGNYLPNDKVGDVLSTTAHSLTAVLGIGILALPSAISYLGWVAGPTLLAIFFLATVFSNYLLCSVYQVHGRQHGTYHYAVRDILESRRYAIVISTVQLVNFVLVMIAFSITGGNAIQQIAKQACLLQGKTEDEIENDQSCLGSGEGGVWQAILIFTGAEWILSVLIKSLSGSTIISIVGMVCGVIYSVVAMSLSFATIPAGGAQGTIGGVMNSAADKAFGILNAVGQISTGYGLALVLLEITDTLRQPPPPVKSMIKTTWFSLSSCFVLYMLVGCGGYASKGNDVAGNILDAFDGPAWALILANSSLLLNVLPSYQIFAQALFDTIESHIKSRMDHRVAKAKNVDLDVIDEAGEELGRAGSAFAFDATSDIRRRRSSRADGKHHEDIGLHYSRSYVDRPAELSKARSSQVEYATAKRPLVSGWTDQSVILNQEGVYLPWGVRLLARSIPIFVVAIIAAVMPFFGAFVGLIGVCTYWPLSIAMPILMFRKTYVITKAFDRLLMGVFWVYLVVTLGALVGAVRSIVVGFSTYKIFGT
jgi:amino acid permease